MTDQRIPGPAKPRTPSVVFVGAGVVLLAIGSSGQRGILIAVGAAFIAIGAVLLVRQERVGGPS
jgi:hypothetical protein